MPRISTRFVTLVAAVGSLAAGPLSPVEAQDPEVSPDERRLTAVFTGLAPDAQVRVVTRQLFIQEARFQSLDGRVLQLAQDGTLIPVPLSDIREVALPSAHPIQGALWGLGGGLLVGSVGGMLVGGFNCTSVEECSSAERHGAIVGSVVLGLLGATTGFLIGRRSVTWTPIFP